MRCRRSSPTRSSAVHLSRRKPLRNAAGCGMGVFPKRNARASGARNPPRAWARGGLRPWMKARGDAENSGSAGLWRPRGSLAPASSDGALPAASTTALRDPSAAAPSRGGLRGALAPYGRARLVVAGGRMSSGPPVRRLAEPCRKKPCSRSGRPSRAHTERPPRDRLPSASRPGAHAVPSPEGSGGRGARNKNSVKDYFRYYGR